MRRWKKIVTAIVVMLLAGILYGWYLYNKEPADTRQQAATVQIEASALVKTFLQNEAAANRQYVDKLIIVSGNISGAHLEADGHATLFLETGDPLAVVTCSFYNEEAATVKNIPVGSVVSIKGICTGILTDVILNKCSLVK
ncbi:hypothetical protein FAM09_13790 [Niastella caeni]|uniref:tRNA_anti-like n=1 Tax=Niastella caeni TaxID=2569763 RepID=A0A4S8HXP6_9BACT|nr:hypothetical protein [Niastella caeni]THU39569.1 hypothetical protein FAM09_13790 [Niastella caeni]